MLGFAYDAFSLLSSSAVSLTITFFLTDTILDGVLLLYLSFFSLIFSFYFFPVWWLARKPTSSLAFVG